MQKLARPVATYSLKTLLVVFALAASYMAGLSSGRVYRIVDDEFVRQQLESERVENAKLKYENEKLRIALGQEAYYDSRKSQQVRQTEFMPPPAFSIVHKP